MLRVSNLNVSTVGKQIIKKANFSLQAGQLLVINGNNGSGKSSLVTSLLGGHQMSVSGKIVFLGQDITKEEIDKRAKKGIFLAPQFPPELAGVGAFTLLRSMMPSLSFVELENKIDAICTQLSLNKTYILRPFNDGFSGGEKKRLELLQYLLINPKLAIFDELDSGLDIEGKKIFIDILRKRPKQQAVILISHDKELIKKLKPDKIYKLEDKILCPDKTPFQKG